MAVDQRSPVALPIDALPLGVAVYRSHDGVTAVNGTWTTLTGCSAATSAGTGFLDAFPETEQASLLALVERVANGGPAVVTERRLSGERGTARWARVRLHGVEGGESGRCVITLDDFTGVKQREEVLTHRANRDWLTGLPNRIAIMTHANRALTRSARRSTTLALLFIDLDDFKEINDALGHAIGDEVLRRIATAFAEVIRPADTVARLGGDEFAVLCEDLTSPVEAQSVAERLLGAAARPLTVDGHDVEVHASIGIAVPIEDAVSATALLELADHAMYRAKRRGGSTWELSLVTQIAPPDPATG